MEIETQKHTSKKKQLLRRIALCFLALMVVVAAALGGYSLYLEQFYTRIADNVSVENQEAGTRSALKLHTDYSALTYNIGFGAYSPDYTFFMDEGEMKDGTKTVGSESRGESYEAVKNNVEGALKLAATANKGSAPDFMLFQEVDTASDRSYNINQLNMIKNSFSNNALYYASNFHTGYLAYPPLKPHGRVNGGLVLSSSYEANSATRRSYPVATDWPTKYFDLDRCFVIYRYPTEDGHELVLINSHMSAYDKGGAYREKQMRLITSVMQDEYEKGNYVIAGGDWNHALLGSEKIYPSEQKQPEWLQNFQDSYLPKGFYIARPDNLEEVASCRGVDIPYTKGVTYTATVDGFIVSPNVTAKAHTIDAGFKYSDHNPVFLDFKLGDASNM